MKFTKKEVSLCKLVAERHRKEIEYGDWFLNEGGFVKVWPYRHNCKRIDVIPLWIISDCLEFLRERKIDCELFELSSERKEGFVRVTLWKTIKVSRHYWFNKNGKTPLEACLKAVLAVIKESE